MTNGSYADQPIERQQLTTWAVMPGGHHIRLDLSTPDGKPGSIVVSFDTLSSLLMTLPRMLQAALQCSLLRRFLACGSGSRQLADRAGARRPEHDP